MEYKLYGFSVPVNMGGIVYKYPICFKGPSNLTDDEAEAYAREIFRSETKDI